MKAGDCHLGDSAAGWVKGWGKVITGGRGASLAEQNENGDAGCCAKKERGRGSGGRKEQPDPHDLRAATGHGDCVDTVGKRSMPSITHTSSLIQS